MTKNPTSIKLTELAVEAFHMLKDKKIDLTLKEPGYTSVKGSALQIVSILKKAGGFIPCHEKSSPEDIKQAFSMSKKEFKRAVGGLYKKGILELEKNGIRLKQ